MKIDLERYFSLNYKKEIFNYKIDNQIKKEIWVNFKNLIHLCDALFILAILFNLGAGVITNVIVVKETPKIEFYETNIKTAEKYNYVPHEQAEKKFSDFIKFIDTWALGIFGYIIIRFFLIYYDYRLIYLFFLVLIYLNIDLGIDFFQNFGYWIGRSIYG